MQKPSDRLKYKAVPVIGVVLSAIIPILQAVLGFITGTIIPWVVGVLVPFLTSSVWPWIVSAVTTAWPVVWKMLKTIANGGGSTIYDTVYKLFQKGYELVKKGIAKIKELLGYDKDKVESWFKTENEKFHSKQANKKDK